MKLKLAGKINVLVISMIIILSITTGFVAFNEITKGIGKFAAEKARGDMHLAYLYLDNKYEGDWEVRGDKLYKGSTLLNENYEEIDRIAQDTDNTVTIFLGDTRISTNVGDGNTRAIGTKASENVAEIVLENGQNYNGEAEIEGEKYQTAYMPLKNKAGEVIGMLSIGAPKEIIKELVSEFLWTLLIVLAVVSILSAVVVMLFTSRIKKRLSRITRALGLAGHGDLTMEVEDHSNDEIGELTRSYNLMSTNLKDLMKKVISASDRVAASSEELTASAEQTSKATETITEAIQEVANGAEQSNEGVTDSAQALEEVTTRVQSIAESASMISEASSQATEKAKEGGVSVRKTVNQINFISRSVDESGHVLQTLDKRSQEVGTISIVISEIAEQTNLLALNAAIEAARAGEHGKGFAVVADEVRKLAEQSRESSAQITALITDIQQDMLNSNKSMAQVSVNVKSGLEVVQEAENKFNEILLFMEELANQIIDMAATTEEVTASIEEVSSTVSEISNVSNETSAHTQNVAASTEEQLVSIEEISLSANSLSHLAEELQEIISRFKV